MHNICNLFFNIGYYRYLNQRWEVTKQVYLLKYCTVLRYFTWIFLYFCCFFFFTGEKYNTFYSTIFIWHKKTKTWSIYKTWCYTTDYKAAKITRKKTCNCWLHINMTLMKPNASWTSDTNVHFTGIRPTSV